MTTQPPPAEGAGSLAAPQRPEVDLAATSTPSSEPTPTRATVRLALVGVALVALGAVGATYSVLDPGHGHTGQAVADREGSPTPTAARPSTSPGTAAPATSGTAPGPGASAAGTQVSGLVAPLLRPQPPWKQVADGPAQTGRVELDRAVAIDGNGELSRTGLRQLGFVVGQSRAWETGTASLLGLDYTFRTAAGATGYVAYGRRARGGDRAYSALRLTSVPGAAAYQATHAGGTTRVVLFASGRSAFLLGIQGTLPAGAAGDLAVLARLQLAAAG